MEFYLAPMEGITGYIYRQAHDKYFHTVDRYVTPFIAPNQNRCMNSREKQDVLPEHNQNMAVVPQIMANQALVFLKTCQELQEMGYSEVNLNLGCPSGTVVAKKRGAGLLGELKMLERFLEEIFAKSPVEISIKTRIGLERPEEFQKLLAVYNQYPVKELIIHPRVQKDYYNKKPNWEVFKEAVRDSRAPLCYNGDLFTEKDYRQLVDTFPGLGKVMLGRGVLVNPNLIGRIRDGRELSKDTLYQFHDQLFREYGEILSGGRNLLFKMKELWFYMCHVFTNPDKYYKRMKKAEKLSVYQSAVEAIFEEQSLKEGYNS